jgi:hypothetical protein
MNLQQKVMWRVYAVWLVRWLTRGVAWKFVVLALVVWQLTSYVSFGHIWENAVLSGTLSGHYGFWLSAFTTTEHVVQFFLSLFLLVAILLLKDIVILLRRRQLSNLF